MHFFTITKKGVFAIYVLINYKAEDDLPILIVQLEDRTKRRILERDKSGLGIQLQLSQKRRGDEQTTSPEATTHYYGTKSRENQQIGRESQAHLNSQSQKLG